MPRSHPASPPWFHLNLRSLGGGWAGRQLDDDADDLLLGGALAEGGHGLPQVVVVLQRDQLTILVRVPQHRTVPHQAEMLLDLQPARKGKRRDEK